MKPIKCLVLNMRSAVPLDQAQEVFDKLNDDDNAVVAEVVDIFDGTPEQWRKSLTRRPTRPGPRRRARTGGKLTPEKFAKVGRLLKAGQSQHEVAEAMGVSRSTIAHIAQGRRTAPLATKAAHEPAAKPEPPPAAKPKATKPSTRKVRSKVVTVPENAKAAS